MRDGKSTEERGKWGWEEIEEEEVEKRNPPYVSEPSRLSTLLSEAGT
jgi:hypothetical protein